MTARHRLDLADREIHETRLQWTPRLRAGWILSTLALVKIGDGDALTLGRVLDDIDPKRDGRVVVLMNGEDLPRWVGGKRVFTVESTEKRAPVERVERAQLTLVAMLGESKPRTAERVARATDAEPTPPAADGQGALNFGGAR
jgi:hypothetical protein